MPIKALDRYETITDLMTLQDQIDTFQKLIFSHFRGGANNECRISALVPLVQESYGIYKFVTSMLRAMHTSTRHSAFHLVEFDSNSAQLRGTMRLWSHYAEDTIHSITVF